MDKIFINDLRVRAIVGIWEWERRLPQIVSIDLEMAADIRAAGARDHIDASSQLQGGGQARGGVRRGIPLPAGRDACREDRRSRAGGVSRALGEGHGAQALCRAPLTRRRHLHRAQRALDVLDALIRTGSGTSQTDIYMTRISINSYARISNKLQTGMPINYWVQRAPTGITLNLWPVPDALQTYTMAYYYMEQIEDTGKPASNTMDVPSRHLPTLVAGLAYQLALKKPDKIQMAPALKAEYESQWDLAADSVREKASWFMRSAV